MATDGDIDFSTYTREQLDSAVTRIDHQRYPINSAKLIDEYQRRKVAEKQAAALAKVSPVAVVPDHMLSTAKAFKVTFEPQSAFLNWLGPSRNDFHLIGSGSVRVDDALVCVHGRRFAYLVGIPVVAKDELGRQYVVNVEVQGRVVRFELRVPGEKVRGVTLWLDAQAEAQELAQLLPSERTADFTPQLKLHIEFEQALISQSPKTPMTYALLFACVFFYVGSVLVTNHPWAFDGTSLVHLGSDFGPYTTDGEWWRVVSSLFLHSGVIHLAFNMWALASFGPIVERLFGSISFLLIYLVAGIGGDLLGLALNPAINSVGASGAIFGLLGALLAAQVRNAGSIPINILRPLRNSSLIFTGFALLAGLLSSGVDNAAHIGGLAAGFVLGLLLSRPITGAPLQRSALVKRIGLAALASVLILAVGVAVAKSASKRLTGEGLYAATLHWFIPGEQAALQRWVDLGELGKAGKLNDEAYADAIDRTVLPFWQEADLRLERIDVPKSSGVYESLQLLQSVTSDRLDDYQAVQQALRHHDADAAARAMADLQHINETIDGRIKARSNKE
jgi:rhomboid protease GluP